MTYPNFGNNTTHTPTTHTLTPTPSTTPTPTPHEESWPVAVPIPSKPVKKVKGDKRKGFNIQISRSDDEISDEETYTSFSQHVRELGPVVGCNN